jgi:hypothetical protein
MIGVVLKSQVSGWVGGWVGGLGLWIHFRIDRSEEVHTLVVQWHPVQGARRTLAHRCAMRMLSLVDCSRRTSRTTAPTRVEDAPEFNGEVGDPLLCFPSLTVKSVVFHRSSSARVESHHSTAWLHCAVAVQWWVVLARCSGGDSEHDLALMSVTKRARVS